jgi:hypothetical protein
VTPAGRRSVFPERVEPGGLEPGELEPGELEPGELETQDGRLRAAVGRRGRGHAADAYGVALHSVMFPLLS